MFLRENNLSYQTCICALSTVHKRSHNNPHPVSCSFKMQPNTIPLHRDLAARRLQAAGIVTLDVVSLLSTRASFPESGASRVGGRCWIPMADSECPRGEERSGKGAARRGENCCQIQVLQHPCSESRTVCACVRLASWQVPRKLADMLF